MWVVLRRPLLSLILLCTSASAASYEVGTFVQAGGASQNVAHGLGVTPVAAFFWSDGQVQEGVVARGSTGAMGLFDGTASRSLSDALADDAGTHLGGRLIAAQTLNFVTFDGSVLAGAVVSGWSSTQFTVSWSPNDGRARQIHYLLIAGAGAQAKVIDWLTPVDAGTLAVTGIGFAPELLINLYAGNGGAALPSAFNAMHSHLSVAGAGTAWSIANYSTTGSNTVASYFNPDAVAVGQSATLSTRGNLSDAGPDGFAMTFPLTAPVRVLTLALRGVPFRVGTFSKATGTAPFQQTVPTPGLNPGAVLIAGVQQPLNAFSPGLAWTVGAATPTARAVSARSKLAALPTQVVGLDSTTALVAHADARADTADQVTFGAGSFALRWTESSNAAMDFGFLALGGLVIVDAGVDAGLDGGSDAGTALVDAGVTSVDAGSVDAGSVDAGSVDAGKPDAGDDGGSRVPTGPLELQLSCGCQSSAHGAFVLALLVGLRRRRAAGVKTRR